MSIKKNLCRSILFLSILFCSLPVFAGTILSESSTRDSYEIIMNGEGTQDESLEIAIQKSASALHKAAQNRLKTFDIHIRIENDGAKEIDNFYPPNRLAFTFNLKYYAFNESPPYTTCSLYETSDSDDRSGSSDNVFDHKIRYNLHYLLDEAEEKRLYNEIRKTARQFIGSDFDKILGIYKYLLTNIEYDHSNTEIAVQQSGIVTFKRKTGICTGYAQLMAEMCNAVGIECYEVGGRPMSEGENHSWVVVKYNGKWYFCDPTQDDISLLTYFLRGKEWWQVNRYDTYGYPDSANDIFYISSTKVLMKRISISKEDAVTPAGFKRESGYTDDDATSSSYAYANTTGNISVKSQQMTVKTKKIKAKEKDLKNKKVVFKAKKVFSVKGAKGKITYKKLKGSNKILVAKNGNITIREGTKKGTYKIKVTVIAAGNSEYRQEKKTITVRIVIK